MRFVLRKSPSGVPFAKPLSAARIVPFLFPLLFSGFVFSCGGDAAGEGRTLQFNGFTLEQSPERFPDLIPVSFRYPDARIQKAAVYDRDPFLSSTQGAAVFQTADSPEEVAEFYREAFERNGWQLIQTHSAEGERLLMAESPSRRLFTVIVRGASPATVKTYIKQASLL